MPVAKNSGRSARYIIAGTAQQGYNLVADADWVAVSGGIVVLISAMLMYNQTTHSLPQTSTTFTVRPSQDLAELHSSSAADLFKSKAAFEASTLHLASHMEAFSALKYTLGCYGRTRPTLSAVASNAWANLSVRQLQKASTYAVSVCTCVDEHVNYAFGSTEFLGVALNNTVELYVDSASNNAIYEGFPLQSMRHGLARLPRMSGNVQARLTDDAQFEKVDDIREWCAQAAAPMYSLHVASVWNSRLLLLTGISLMLIGLDLFSTRRLVEGNLHVVKWSLVWLLDCVPFFFFLVRLLMEAVDTHLIEHKTPTSFLMAFVFLGIVITFAVLLVFSLWANWYRRGNGTYNGLWERIFVDLPMLVGLGLVGVALKMQNDEHDEIVLLGTLLLLLAGGLLQHISNLVKVVYDIVCTRFNSELLEALNTGATFVKDDSDSGMLDHTRVVLQNFGWTRLYGFFAVLLCGLLSLTISSTTSLSQNPLQFITQNQYVYFVLAYVVALTGLDLFYEAIPFVTEKDTQYGEEAADRLRKLFVCVYLIFLLLAQYTVEASEL